MCHHGQHPWLSSPWTQWLMHRCSRQYGTIPWHGGQSPYWVTRPTVGLVWEIYHGNPGTLWLLFCYHKVIESNLHHPFTNIYFWTLTDGFWVLGREVHKKLLSTYCSLTPARWWAYLLTYLLPAPAFSPTREWLHLSSLLFILSLVEKLGRL
jgi:hypothetical protein